MENNEQSGSKKIYLAIIAVLLLINGVAGYLLFSENKQKQEKIAEIAKKDTEYTALNQQFETAKQDLEGLKGKNSELDSIVTARQATIEKYQSQLAEAQRKGNLSAAELSKFKSMVANLQAENATLSKKVEELTSQNQELSAKNLAVSADLEKEKQTTASLSDDKAALAKKVEIGSLIQPQNLTIEGVHKKSNGKEVAKKKAKDIEYLKISFATGENKVLEKGNLPIFVRIINPKGETISVGDQGSGKLKLAENGEDVQYSKKADIDYQQTNKNVIIEWSQNIKEAGTYKVELYQSGYKIGSGSIELK